MFRSPARPLPSRRDTRVCVSERSSPSETATGVEGSVPPPAPSPAPAGKHKEWGKKAHITSSLRVKDRPPCERLLRAALSRHIAGDYTLCHRRADLAFFFFIRTSAEHQVSAAQSACQHTHTHTRWELRDIPGIERGQMYRCAPPPQNQDLESRFGRSAAAGPQRAEGARCVLLRGHANGPDGG